MVGMFILLGVGLTAALVGSLVGDDDDDTAEAGTQRTDDQILIEGTEGPDVFPDLAYGTNVAEQFDLKGGADRAFGNGGDDFIDLGAGPDFANGGTGADTLGEGMDTLFGSGGNDLLQGGAEDDFLAGESGNDRLEGGGGDDTLFGSFGDDALFGGGADDFLSGGAGQDLLEGGAGDDILDGVYQQTGRETDEATAFDVLDLDPDTLNGGAGEDALLLGPGDTGTGGADEDTFGTLIGPDWTAPATITDMEPGGTLFVDITPLDTPADPSLVTRTDVGQDVMVAFDGVDIVLLRGMQGVTFDISLSKDGAGVVV